jgi:FMN phosphatase YigB (HAD superfamily)
VNPVTESRSRIQAVVFDVGETLVDETRAWSYEAKRAGVTPLTLFAALGALIEQGNDHREVWALLGVEPPTRPLPLEPGDFYPDALPCLRDVAAAGLRVGIAGNQPEAAEEMLRSLDAPLSLVASSSRWGVEAVTCLLRASLCRDGRRARWRRLRR